MKTFKTLKEGMKKTKTMKDIMRVYGRDLKKAERTGNLDLPTDVEDALKSWVFKNEPYVGDDPDDFDEWLDNNIEDIVKGKIKESVEVNEKLKGYQSSYQRVSKYDGKEFNAKQEFKTLDKIQKALEVADKHHADLQYPYVVDTVNKIWDHLKEASIGIIEYKRNIKDGKYDGVIDKDD